MTEAPPPALKLHRFIPFRRKAILEMLEQDQGIEGARFDKFRELMRIVEAYYHFQFHAKLEELKDAYFPFNPDVDVKMNRVFDSAELSSHAGRLNRMLLEVLNDANFEEVTHAEIERALAEESLFSLKLTIDFKDFEHCLIFVRGNVIKKGEIKRRIFWKAQIDIPTYERVVLFIRFKEKAQFEAQNRKNLLFEPGSTIIKIFKDMPHADLEMLFPNTELEMRTLDKLLLGIPAIGGAIPILLTKVLPHLPIFVALLLAWMGIRKFSEEHVGAAVIQGLLALIVFAAYCLRQWDKFRHRRIAYMQTLTQSLYFKNLGNNAGVFHQLIDAAEEEEVKEAILAYYFLLVHGPQDPKALDVRIETWLKDKHNAVLDFEVDGGLNKLATLGIGHQVDGKWQVMPLEEALRHVDSIWDNFFEYNDAGGKTPPKPEQKPTLSAQPTTPPKPEPMAAPPSPAAP